MISFTLHLCIHLEYNSFITSNSQNIWQFEKIKKKDSKGLMRIQKKAHADIVCSQSRKGKHLYALINDYKDKALVCDQTVS